MVIGGRESLASSTILAVGGRSSTARWSGYRAMAGRKRSSSTVIGRLKRTACGRFRGGHGMGCLIIVKVVMFRKRQSHRRHLALPPRQPIWRVVSRGSQWALWPLLSPRQSPPRPGRAGDNSCRRTKGLRRGGGNDRVSPWHWGRRRSTCLSSPAAGCSSSPPGHSQGAPCIG
jgi:hypothetical protein